MLANAAWPGASKETNGANSRTAVNILRYLSQESVRESTLKNAISLVWDKWINPNSVVSALLHGDGTFYEYMRRKCCRSTNDSDHLYVPPRKSYKEFKESCSRVDFDVISAMDSFVPASVDSERLFSWGRLSKNHLQHKMDVYTQSRNALLRMNKHLR